MKIEELLKKAIEFYKENNRMVSITKDSRDLVDLVCHVRHAKESKFEYKSLSQRFPNECEFIQEREKEIYISDKLKNLKKFLKEITEKEGEKRAPKINKKEIEQYLFWSWCKNEVEEENHLKRVKINLDFLFNIEKEMEVVTDFTLPNSKAREKMRRKGKEIYNTDLIKAEELQNKVSKYWKIKETLFNYYGRFMNCPYKYNYRFNLELQTAVNEFIVVYKEFNDYLKEKKVFSLMKENHYIKEVIEDKISKKIVFKGEHFIEKENKKKPKSRKKEEA